MKYSNGPPLRPTRAPLHSTFQPLGNIFKAEMHRFCDALVQGKNGV